MNTNIFQTELNEYCGKFLIKKSGKPDPSPIEFIRESKKTATEIFEQFLLFDTVSFKVHGENVPLAVLLNYFGVKGVEALLEQGALKFVLWNHMLTYFVDDIPGADPLQSGIYTSKPHSDPEESTTLGFNWMKNKPKESDKKNLIRKVCNAFTLPNDDLSKQSVESVKSAYNSGKLKAYDFDPEKCAFRDLKLAGRKRLCSCADEVLQYSHLLNENLTSYNSFEFFLMFEETHKKLLNALSIRDGYERLAKLENIPDMQSLCFSIKEPFNRVLDIRSKTYSKKFRSWMAECSGSSDCIDITKEYVDAIANSKGFFQTKKGRFTKNIAMSAIGAGIGGLIAGPAGAAGGATVGKILEPAADFGLDLLDEFVLSGLTKGWTPKLFFNDIEKLKKI